MIYPFRKKGVQVMNYIYNLIGVCPAEVAESHLPITRQLLADLKFSHYKSMPPSTCVIFLGIEVDCNKGVLRIPEDKFNEIINICNLYMNRKHITKTQLKTLIGSLIFIYMTIKPTHTFMHHSFGKWVITGKLLI
jgi:hypothetical protein